MKPIKLWAASLCLVAMVGCSEDLGPVTAAWSRLSQGMTAKLAAYKDQYAGLQSAVKGLPMAPDTDAPGKALRTRLDQAVDGAKQALRAGDAAGIGKALEELQQAYSAAGASLYQQSRGADPSAAGAAGEAQPGAAGAEQPKQENVVDADYEIVDDDKNKK